VKRLFIRRRQEGFGQRGNCDVRVRRVNNAPQASVTRGEVAIKRASLAGRDRAPPVSLDLLPCEMALSHDALRSRASEQTFFHASTILSRAPRSFITTGVFL
jgi:hypothetical protein